MLTSGEPDAHALLHALFVMKADAARAAVDHDHGLPVVRAQPFRLPESPGAPRDINPVLVPLVLHQLCMRNIAIPYLNEKNYVSQVHKPCLKITEIMHQRQRIQFSVQLERTWSLLSGQLIGLR